MVNSLRILAFFLLLMSVFGFMYRLTKTFDSYIPFFFNQISTSRTISPKDILSQGNGIIFIETTDRLKPSPLVLCAIESAARVYNDRPVAFFMKGLSNVTTEEDENRIRKNFSTLSAFENVYFFPLKMEEVFKDTPLLPWYLKVDPKLERHWVHVSSDGCRLALIWKHGGIYMDTDIISIRQIPDKDFLAAQSSKYSSNGVFGLSVDHDFCWKSMESFVKNYNGAAWGHQGPELFTRVLKQYCTLPAFKSLEDIMCGNISFLNPQRFYPISYPSWRLYYSVWEKLPTFNDSYALHLWNYMNNEKRSVIPGSNTLVDHLYQQYCPNIYESVKGNKTKAS
ncbi:alpha-1,4-N-acetylglucosaminyltransferase-like [Bombina bombina]|uniref:alpha-1,4-N-acetylglucosaminyltransferase-like n=1 Tax=Bombina bombina TaxID=8345 RepID=UPI00235AFD47|nr:alpha-1,4-N-acetylglucosaminyltransferase-like [Bombina bombina]